jgi:hypothetical protein
MKQLQATGNSMRNVMTLLAAAMFLAAMPAAPSHASETEFYKSIQGRWVGPGEIVAGKYKGTKFHCDFNGLTPATANGMEIDGNCRVGVFNQPMNASVSRSGRGFSGKFLDGQNGDGMDVVGGRFSGSKLVIDVKRKDLNGVMIARLNGEDKLNITVSVRVDKQLIPVIGMALDRVSNQSDTTVTGSVERQAKSQ